ncbi:S8 family serine peptidase [Novosphingobium profundi]|uniref:S8 family serine peptidase n=1 Tax=Novosphingobium profundi TaxID=1774954 RepID=UPI001BD9E3D1|nr:S8 family serine peptidase [Novosphingobium profundi]MBT0667177.1 S8 family serine peptidase [Novosphingobium profundi]
MDKTIISTSNFDAISANAFYYNDKYEKKEWYLDGSTTDSALSIDVFPVWADYSGKGVKVGVIDSQIDFTHSDIKHAYASGLDYNFTLGTDNVTIDPAALPYFHGTAVAGVISAEANNGVGTVGIASGATLVGYGVDYGASTAVTDILAALQRAVDVDVANNSWSFNSNFADNFTRNPTYGEALLSSVIAGRGGLGTSQVFAAGNAGTSGSSNYHNFQNSPYAIAVGAVDPTGAASSFSSVGANVLISAAGRDVFTTTLKERYESYNGTSFAAPAVSATIALMLEANPDLGYRDIQQILAYSAHREGLADTTSFGDGWLTNGANNANGGGLHFSDAFGYGFLNVHDAVRLAETWDRQQTYANLTTISKTVTTSQTLTAGSNDHLSLSIQIDKPISVEHVQLSMDLRWTQTANLDVYLVSPEGTQVRLVYDLPGLDNVGNIRDFTFSSVASMGELSVGTWTLEIYNRNPSAVDKNGNPLTGLLRDATLTLQGNSADLNNDLYIYTNEFGSLYKGADLAQRAILHDTNGGIDTLNAAAITSASTIDLSGNGPTILAGVTLALDGSIENAYTGDGNDTVRGNDAANRITTGRGDDTIYFTTGGDTLDGGAGQDTLIFGSSVDKLAGSLTADGTLALSLGSGAATLVTNIENFVFSEGSYSLAQILDRLGSTTPQSSTTANVEVPQVPTNESTTTDIAANAPAQETTTSTTTTADLTNTKFVQTLTGTTGDDTIKGGLGADYIDGGLGADRLYGGDGTDKLLGGYGDDLLRGDAGDDWLFGGQGADKLYGGDGADTFVVDISELGALDCIYDFNASAGDRILVTGLSTAALANAEFTLQMQSTSSVLQLIADNTVYDIARIKGEGVETLSTVHDDMGLLFA